MSLTSSAPSSTYTRSDSSLWVLRWPGVTLPLPCHHVPHTDHLSVSQTWHAHSCPRAFAPAVPSCLECSPLSHPIIPEIMLPPRETFPGYPIFMAPNIFSVQWSLLFGVIFTCLFASVVSALGTHTIHESRPLGYFIHHYLPST